MTQISTLRPMGLLEIVDQTFRLYRRNFWLFLGISAMPYFPLALLQAHPGLGAVAALLFWPFSLVAVGALTRAVSDRYLGDQATIGGSYRFMLRRVFPFIGTLVVAYIFVLMGVVLLVVGMIVFAFWVVFITEVFVIEGKRYFAAIWRSKFLVGKGVWAEVLVLGMMTGFLTLLVQGAAGTALGAPLALISGEPTPVSWILEGAVIGIVNSLAVPIGLIASILLYYDSRIRKEGFDLEILARELGKAVPPQPEPQLPQGPGQEAA